MPNPSPMSQLMMVMPLRSCCYSLAAGRATPRRRPVMPEPEAPLLEDTPVAKQAAPVSARTRSRTLAHGGRITEGAEQELWEDPPPSAHHETSQLPESP